MRADQLHAASRKMLAQPIGIGGFVVEQPFRHAVADPHVDQCFDRTDFGMIGRCGECGQRQSVSVYQQHQLGALASFRLTNVQPPFFAGENVPSPIASDQSIRRRLSIWPSSRCQTFSHTPDSVHSRCRRQHVTGLGYRSGKSFHRQPFFNTKMTPSKHARDVTRGRPPLRETGRSGNRSSINDHWYSEMKGFGAVLDPVLFDRRCVGHVDRENNHCKYLLLKEGKCNNLANQ